MVLAAFLAAGGCSGSADSPDPPQGIKSIARASDSPPQNLDAGPRQMRILAVQIYVIELPRGRVSANEPLWRRIDEQNLNPGLYDVLWANGVRVGMAPLAELAHIRETLEIETAMRLDILGRGIGRQVKEFSVEPEVVEKTLFWFDAGKRHHGRTFQRCETLMSIAFEPTPGQEQMVRLSMTPMVRANHPRLVVTPRGDDYTITEEKDTSLLDLQLLADVPIGQFLLVSPSDELQWETSLGRQFFCTEREGELFEKVYLLIPQITALKNDPQH